ncbi:hypothetical protein R77567_01268 [Ralstonia sp. LMG 32965]|uniref:GH16 domain-containing protein n=2 Tax=Ralstonia flatus TaxID=3058601 RepID=A0AAD2BXF6_9RALS|nr:hypothetical protein R77567_01268 [Ralstonia sp. LMG 32965]CAJ0861530.1 hypothetical protein R77564_00834 [Ralstonia sp. LMG 32965]
MRADETRVRAWCIEHVRDGMCAIYMRARHLLHPLCVALPFALHVSVVMAQVHTIDWAGMKWRVRTEQGGPCATQRWNADGVWVDAAGQLHLKLIRMPSGVLSCAEIISLEQFRFGTYQFEVTGPIGTIDANVALGIFFYPSPDVGPDGTNEIDIEVARWGRPDGPQVHYTAWYRSRPGSWHLPMRVADQANHAQFGIQWLPGSVRWTSSLQGATEAHFEGDVASQPQTLRFNLWLFRQPAPVDGREVEFVIKSMKVREW